MCTLKHNTYIADELFSWCSSDRPCAFDICLPVPYKLHAATSMVCVSVCYVFATTHNVHAERTHTQWLPFQKCLGGR